MRAEVSDIAAAPEHMPAWYEVSAAFTAMHALSLLLFVAMIVGASVLGRRWRGTAKETRLRRAWGGAALAFLVACSVYFVLPGNYVPGWSLPLHVCDLVGFIACLSLLVRVRWLVTTTVFLGLALCTQAFITPVVRVGPVYLHYWYFWMGHTAIVLGAVYHIAVDRYRPTLTDLGLAWLTLSAYVGWVLPMDIAQGWNYGFVGNPPPRPDAPPTIVEHLGPWPTRVYMLGVLGCGMMGMIYGAFVVARVMGRRTDKRE